jgi:DNA-binding IclR family transcriptional regulator
MSSPRPGIQSIERAARVLRRLSGPAARVTVAELARDLQLPKGTVQGILRTLISVGLVERDDESGRYLLGPAVLHMGSSYLDGNELRSRAVVCADALATRTRQSVWIGTMYGGDVLVVHHVPRPDDDNNHHPGVGSVVPAHATALGKALLTAYLPDLPPALFARGDNGANHRGLAGYTPDTITDVEQLCGELTEANVRGWTSELGELIAGRASIAAPIEDRRRVVVGAIGIAGSSSHLYEELLPRDDLVEHVIDAARRISRQLGGGPW